MPFTLLTFLKQERGRRERNLVLDIQGDGCGARAATAHFLGRVRVAAGHGDLVLRPAQEHIEARAGNKAAAQQKNTRHLSGTNEGKGKQATRKK